ncbi:hypothetical protein IHV04_07520 [Bifidobacterium dentium]|uniref:hypothetical protein n=1 Tax=Bifidobacterium dentium TaxID=1689 RepID=UPI0018C1E9A8|nr:hypothetical protein [Bifidobacterium dentium]MBF9702450.1 hypothetical protein [Bifidobacterium dentium]
MVTSSQTPNITSLVLGDDEPDGDGLVLTRLATRLQNRIPDLCTLKTFYDGREQVPLQSVPKSATSTASAIYRRFVDICPLNLAHTIVDAVVTSQHPTGFRLVADKTMRSTEADDMWDKCGMDVRALNMFMDASLYGAAYAMVFSKGSPSYIQRLSPWTTEISDDKDSAIVYGWSEDEQVERITLYRIIRNDDGQIQKVYSRTAKHETKARTLPSDSVDDEDAVYGIANDDSQKRPQLEAQFEWEGASSDGDWAFAVKCGCLPIVKMTTPNGKGQFESSLKTLKSIDQQRFQRLCIQEMQAFKQRWVQGDMPEYYQKNDPAVKANRARAGDKIDYSELFEMGPAALWLLPADAKIGESSITDITPIVTAASSDIKHLAGSTGTPLSILSPDTAGSAEGAKLTTRMLRLKVRDMNMRANDAFVLLLKMALTASGSNASEERFETTWEPIDLPTELEMAEAASQVKGVIPLKTIARRFLHMTETEIAEMIQDAQDTSFLNAMSRQSAALDANAQQTESLADSSYLDDTGSFSSDSSGSDGLSSDVSDEGDSFSDLEA